MSSSSLNPSELGQQMHQLATRLFPICRSLSGAGTRQTLSLLQESLPGLTLHEVASGTQCFDWTIPDEWNIKDAYIKDSSGNRVVDFKENNLHVVGYSTPVNEKLGLSELQEHLYSDPEMPDAIPYITSYYQKRWGFCLSENQRRELRDETYEVCIDSTLEPGSLTYADLLIPGESEKEVLLSTYVCHPSMANNELSGPVVTTFLANWLTSLPKRRLSYRIVIVPETIGSICYISRNLQALQKNVVAGYVVTCIGDERTYSYLPSRMGDSLADRAALHALGKSNTKYDRYSFLDRGSDERQYCSPGVDLPVASLMRSKYGTFPEYHTSLDNLDFVTADGLAGGFEILRKSLECIELNETLATSVKCEPQLGKRGLYPTLSTRETGKLVEAMMNLLAYADGSRDLLEIADTIGLPIWELRETVEKLKANGILVSN